jgi:hypothetical protein
MPVSLQNTSQADRPIKYSDLMVTDFEVYSAISGICCASERCDRNGTMVVVYRSCKDCNGSGICVHGKLKRSCKECSTDMCEHKRRRYYCRDCGGAGHACLPSSLSFCSFLFLRTHLFCAMENID